MGTEGGGIKAFADIAQDVHTLVNNAEDLEAVAYDSLNDMLYYSSYVTVYRMNPEGTSIWRLSSMIIACNALQVQSSSVCPVQNYLFKIKRIFTRVSCSNRSTYYAVVTN